MEKKKFFKWFVLLSFAVIESQTMISPNPLIGLPSAEGSHITSIRAMSDNTVISIGMPAADPNWGRQHGAAYSEKSLIYSPTHRGFFKTGEGDHAHVKANGYGQDDFFFYDINAHRWICLYPGTDTRNFNNLVARGVISVDSNGQSVDTTGQPIPGHLNIHAWGSLAYNTDQEKFVFGGGPCFLRYYMPGITLIDSGLKVLEANGLNAKDKQFCPWAYNAQTGKFERELTANQLGSGDIGGFGQCLYIPSNKKFFFAANLGVTYFDPAAKKWDPMVTDITHPKDWTYDFGACHDSKRDRIYMGQNADNFYWYDIATGKWTKIANPNNYNFRFRSVYGAIVYDIKNDVVLLFSWTQNDGRAGMHVVYPLDPETNTWGTPVTFQGDNTVSYPTFAAGYDPVLGVIYIFTAGDSGDNGVMGIFKYKKNDVGTEVRAASQKGAKLTVSPNPFNASAYVQLHSVNNRTGSLVLYDLNGRKVLAVDQNQWNGNSCTIRGSSLPGGTYIAVYVDKGEVVRTPLILIK